MEKESSLNLIDIGDFIFRGIQGFLLRNGNDSGVDLNICSSPLQESFFLALPDSTKLLIKVFPHKNFLSENVYRIEVYKTKPGDMRGNKVGFLEVSQESEALSEIRLFLEGVLSQTGV